MRETDHAGAMDAIRESTTPVVVDLHAPWCGFCTRTRPHLERIAGERGDELLMLAIDTDEHPEAYESFRVKTLPAILLFRDGKEVARHESGDHAALTAWLAENGA